MTAHSKPAAILAIALAALATTGCVDESEADLIASANTSLAARDRDAAVVQLKKALQRNPQSEAARQLMGRVLLESGNARDAVVELGKAYDINPSAPGVQPLLAKALVASGNTRELISRFADRTGTDPRDTAEVKAQLARAYYIEKQEGPARVALNAALGADPKNTTARLMQARVKLAEGSLDQAKAIVAAVTTDDAAASAGWQMHGELALLDETPDYAEALKSFRRAIELEPRASGAYAGAIRVLMIQNDLPGVKELVAQLGKALPGSIESQFYETELALIQGDIAKAQQGAQQLLKWAPRYAPVLQLAGLIDLRAGELLTAERKLTQALQIAPELVAARRSLAEVYLRGGQYTKVVTVLEPLLNAAGRRDAEALGLAAQALLMSGNPDRAEIYLQEAAKANPKDSRVRVQLALRQVARGQSEAGFAELETIATKEKSTYADLGLVSARLRARDFDGALKAVDRLQEKLPSDASPYLIRGQILAQRNDAVGARSNFEKALAIDPKNFPAVSALASLDLAANKPDEARKRFEALLLREPDEPRVMLAVAALRQRTGADLAGIESLLTGAVQANPMDVSARLALIEHHIARRHPKEALLAAQDAVAAIPDNVLLQDALGRAQLATGDTQQALLTFRQIANTQSSLPEPFLRLAEVYLAARDFESAKANLRKALEVSPKLLAAQQMLVQLALARSRPDDAVQVARQVQKERPAEAVGYVMEADIQFMRKAWEPAISALRAALTRAPLLPIATKLHVTYNEAGRRAEADRFAAAWMGDHPRDAGFLTYLGMAASVNKDYGIAESRFREVLALRPDDPAALNNVADSMARQGKADALPLAKRANELAPGQPPLLDTLASAYEAAGTLPDALEAQKQAVSKAPDVPGYRLHLAKLLIAAGDKTAARTELDKLAALGGRFGQQAEVARLLKGL